MCLIFDDYVRVYFSCRYPNDNNGQATSYGRGSEKPDNSPADGTHGRKEDGLMRMQRFRRRCLR